MTCVGRNNIRVLSHIIKKKRCKQSLSSNRKKKKSTSVHYHRRLSVEGRGEQQGLTGGMNGGSIFFASKFSHLIPFRRRRWRRGGEGGGVESRLDRTILTWLEIQSAPTATPTCSAAAAAAVSIFSYPACLNCTGTSGRFPHQCLRRSFPRRRECLKSPENILWRHVAETWRGKRWEGGIGGGGWNT